MSITGADLGGWLCIYFGIGLIRASLTVPNDDSGANDPRSKLGAPGYCLLVVGACILGLSLLGHFH
jgi:hypothetical protein